MNEQVESYIRRQKSPQNKIIRRLRNIILKTFPKIHEEYKMGVPWYEGKFYLVALKDSVNLGFAVQGLTEKQIENFKGQGEYMRHLKFHTLKDIDKKHVIKLLKMVYKKKKK